MCEWYVIDVMDKVFGCVVSEVVCCLCGKYKFEFILYVDIGDFIIIINVSKLKVMGNKMLDKKYYCYLGYLGGIYEMMFGKMQECFLGCVFEKVVKGMLLKGLFGYVMIKKLKVYVEVMYLYLV